MTLDEWLGEQEGFSGPRILRLLDDIESPHVNNDRIIKWLRTAYDIGYDHAMSQLQDDGK